MGEWVGGEVGLPSTTVCVPVQLRMCWVLLLLCVLLASWVGELVLKMRRGFECCSCFDFWRTQFYERILPEFWIMGILKDGADLSL